MGLRGMKMTRWRLNFVLGLNVNGVLIRLMGHRRCARGLRARGMLLGRRLAILHAVFEAFDRSTQVGTDIFELFGSKHQNDDQQND